MKYVYLVAAVLGAVIPLWFNVHAIEELGPTGFTPQAFVMVGFEGSAMLGSLAADFWIGSTASLVFMVVEARRIGMRHVWLLVVLTFVVAWACALPLFFFLRERHLELQKEAAPST